MPQYASALGVCSKCSRDKVQVEGGDVKCIFCDYDFNEPKGPVVNIPDPGEDEINKVLRATGVRVATSDSQPPAQKTVAPKVAHVPASPIPQLTVPVAVDFNSHVQNVLAVMEHLPMPRDIKQVKLVYKVIADLKKLLGE